MLCRAGEKRVGGGKCSEGPLEYLRLLVEYDFRIRILCELTPTISQRVCTNSLKFKESPFHTHFKTLIEVCRARL